MIGDFHKELVDQLSREIRRTGAVPRFCWRCGNWTVYPPDWSDRNGMDASGAEVCALCYEELKLIDDGVIK